MEKDMAVVFIEQLQEKLFMKDFGKTTILVNQI